MRHIIQTIAIFFAFSNANFASTTNVSTPFQNVLLNPNNTIVSNYSFGIEPIIFCFTNSLQTVGNVTWTYKGQNYSAAMPLYLKTNGNYQGAYADSNGTLTITNNTGSQIVVSCMLAL